MTKFIDFNSLATGTVVDNEFSSQGVTISASGGSNKAMIFNTAHPTGGDEDLRTTNLGKALIISEDGDSHDPDDEGDGGTITFDFDDLAYINRLTFLDIEEGAYVRFFDEDGHLIKKVSVHDTDNNGQAIVDFDVDGVASMEVELKGSGAIDNLVFHDSGPDGVVEGDNGGNLIDVNYMDDPEGDRIDADDQILPGEDKDDDIVDALGGDDTIKSGKADDEVYAGSGNDKVEGGDGDDIIYGDSNYSGPGAGTTTREVFEWEKSGFGDDNDLGNFTQDTGNVDVSFKILSQSGASDTEQSNDTQNIQNIDGDGNPIDNNSSLSNVLNGNGNSADYELTFSDQVDDVSFRINDIDGDGVVRVKAYNAAGQQIVVNLEGGSKLTMKDTDGVAGNDTADSNGGYLSDTSEEYSVLVSIPGPVARIVIEHDQNGGNNSGINITDVYFDAPVIDDGLDGNDSLKGGDGDDTIFGEGGDDTLKGEDDNDSLVGGDGNDRLEGGNGNDTLEGGAGHDVILGGNGDDVISGGAGDDMLKGGADKDIIFGDAGDTVDGGSGGFNSNPTLNTDFDVLDLTGQGPFFIDNRTPDANGNGFNGTIVFVDGAGNPNGLTLDFTEIEDVIGDEINRDPDAVNDTATVDEDGSVDIDVLANDSDPDGNDLEVTSATSPDGDVTINPDGTLTFEPTENFNGPTTITYTISDGNGGSDTATVNVTVNPVNDEPVANDDAATTDFNTNVVIDVLDNDTDIDGDTLRVTTASSPNGVVVINADGDLSFTPTDGFEGDAIINYTITDDNGGFDSAQVTVTVNPNPLDGIVEGTDAGELIDVNYDGDPEGDMVDSGDNIFSNDPAKKDDDIIQAGGGNDTVEAGAGDDDVDAGTGNDEVDGGDGDDTIDGGIGDDTLTGGKGSDSVLGGDGNDVIDTDNGSFRIDKGYPGVFTGEEGTPAVFDDRDTVDGGDGDDTIRTGDDNDSILGGQGADVIDGGIDDDFIDGGSEGDRIVGGEGEDSILGGTGNDTIYAGNDPDLGLEQFNIEDDGSNPLGPDLRPDNGRDTVDGGEGNDLIFGADDDDVLLGGSGNDTIDGEIDDDFIDGGIGNDSLLGGQGNDTIEGGDGNDVIDAGRNADTVDGGDGNDTIFGDNGADLLKGGAGDDVIDGGTGDDTLKGDAGNDSILGSTGDDVIEGGDGRDTIDGGNGGQDIMSGGADEDLFVNVDAGEFVDGNEEVTTGIDFDTLDLRGSAPSDGSLQVVEDFPGAESGVVNYFDKDGNPAGQLVYQNIENIIPCFTPGTLIATPSGERRVEELEVGDRVITRDNGIQEIRWIGKRDMSGNDLAAAEHLRPVLIRKGALGKGLPERDMLVSPQHRVLMASDKTALYFDESEVLVAAKHLTGMDGIDVVDVSETTYIHVMFSQHEVILSDGAWTESFQPGDMTLGAMGDAQRAEILELFPELETAEGIEAYAAARRSLKKHEAQLLT